MTKSCTYRLFALAALAGSGLGCHKDLDTVYGQRSGPGATDSVNGTAVFADMFEAAGHHVSSWTSLSPRLDEADCVVWFPNDFDPPSPRVVYWFGRWLNARPDRTLIYVGRDFDAEPWYWRKVEPAAPPEKREAIAAVRREAEERYRAARPNPTKMACEWFSVDYNVSGGSVKIDVDKGDSEWAQLIDESKLEIECNSRISLPMLPTESRDPTYSTLLESDRGTIVSRHETGESQLFVVANGSFLLNAMLVNHEHRKLAGKLIDAIGPAGRKVVFLESGKVKIDEPKNPLPTTNPGHDPFDTGPDDSPWYRPPGSDNDPPINDAEPDPEYETGLKLLLVWPTNWIVLHFALIGILFCFWKLPIFGLPRPADPSGAADFSRHVDAVAALLERTADRNYAQSRIKHYQQVVKPKSEI
jgi:hypothetical protein